jgi:hypothetical protein
MEEIIVRDHVTTLKSGISRTKEFERKGLACFACNCGCKCGHDCTYCSTGAMLRMHCAFRQCGENPFGTLVITHIFLGDGSIESVQEVFDGYDDARSEAMGAPAV